MDEAQFGGGLTIERRERAVVTGVEEVDCFDEEQVTMRTAGGRLVLTGGGLHVESLQLEQGRLVVTGRIDGASWSETRRVSGFLRRAAGR